jgi:hypothetical protein
MEKSSKKCLHFFSFYGILLTVEGSLVCYVERDLLRGVIRKMFDAKLSKVTEHIKEPLLNGQWQNPKCDTTSES